MTVITVVECEGSDNYLCKLGNTPDMKNARYTENVGDDMTVAAAFPGVLDAFLSRGLLPLLTNAPHGVWLVIQDGQRLDF